MTDNSGPARCPRCGWPTHAGALDRRSTHRTSAGSVRYTRCVCGVWLVELGGHSVAAIGETWL